MWRIFALLFVILGMISITSSISLYNYYAGQQAGYKIINDIENKLDVLHNSSQKVLNQQGNLSSDQRQKIINDFEQLPEGGIASHQDVLKNTHVLQEILGNLTKH